MSVDTKITGASEPVAPLALPWLTRGVTNAFFGLAFNILVNVLTLTTLSIAVVKIPSGDVLGAVLPALGVALVLGNLYYMLLARRLARREGRATVTARPYGPSVRSSAGSPREPPCSAPWPASPSPFAMRPAAQMWEAAWTGLPVLAILIGFFTDVRLPGNIPVGLVALLVDTAIGWIGGYMSAPVVSKAAHDIALGLPDLRIDLLFDGLGNLAPLLATAIPLGVYNFTEAMSNVESAAAAGDNYNLRSALLADGFGAIIGSGFGSPFPPAVYIGHPGWKDADGRTGDSLTSGAVIGLMCLLGLFGLLATVLPIPAIVPIPAGLVLGAIVTFVLEKRFVAAALAVLVSAVLSWIGLIHAAEVDWAAAPQVALGYLFFGVVCLGRWPGDAVPLCGRKIANHPEIRPGFAYPHQGVIDRCLNRTRVVTILIITTNI